MHRRLRLNHILYVIALCLSHHAQAQGMLTPLPDTARYACNAEYMKAADAYRPVVGDIMRFDAMFKNYVALCAKQDPRQIKAIQPFIDKMKPRMARDIAESKKVMTRIIHERLPSSVPAPCRADRGAQDQAAKQFNAAMADQRRMAARRMDRSADQVTGDESGQVCHDLSSIRDDLENHVSDKTLSHPLFEIAWLRGRMVSQGSATNRAYTIYRDTLRQLQKGGPENPY